jgi:hypothetical protein
LPSRAYRGVIYGLLASAFDEAKALGSSWVGPEDFLLAILASKEACPATATLTHFGVTHEAFARDLIATVYDPPVDPPGEDDSPELNPAAHELMGRAEGLAIGLGAPAVTLEHVLIAYVWDDSGQMEVGFGVEREAVIEHLRALGVQVPATALPARPPPQGRRVFVPYDHFDAILEKLQERLPANSGFGLNWDPPSSRAWVSAHADVDLAEHVNAVLADLGLEAAPRPDDA